MEPVARVLIVDDQRLFAEAVSSALADRGVGVLGIATSSAEALDIMAAERADVVLVDIGLADESGVTLGMTILDRWPGTKVIALTVLEYEGIVQECLQAGLHGYISKRTPIARFSSAMTSVLAGEIVVLTEPTFKSDSQPGGARPAELLSRQLTRRELDVLGLLVEGVSGREIARRLLISHNTVRTHIQNILTKLQVHSRNEAAAFVIKNGVDIRTGQELRERIA